MEFGERLRYLRGVRSKSQTDIASLAGVANTYLSDLENGRKGIPTGEVLARLASALDTTTDYLLGRTDAYTPPESPVIVPLVPGLTPFLEAEIRAKLGAADYPLRTIELMLEFLRQTDPSTKSD